MKALVLFITAVFIMGFINLVTPKPVPHTETESANNICAISKDDFDYVLQMKDVGMIYRIEDRREAFIGTHDDGIEFDGENAYQYKTIKKRKSPHFPLSNTMRRRNEFWRLYSKSFPRGSILHMQMIERNMSTYSIISGYRKRG